MLSSVQTGHIYHLWSVACDIFLCTHERAQKVDNEERVREKKERIHELIKAKLFIWIFKNYPVKKPPFFSNTASMNSESDCLLWPHADVSMFVGVFVSHCSERSQADACVINLLTPYWVDS